MPERPRRPVPLPGPALTNERQPPAEFSENYELEQAIARLPDSFREIVLLRYYSGLNCSQVAEKLNQADFAT